MSNIHCYQCIALIEIFFYIICINTVLIEGDTIINILISFSFENFETVQIALVLMSDRKKSEPL